MVTYFCNNHRRIQGEKHQWRRMSAEETLTVVDPYNEHLFEDTRCDFCRDEDHDHITSGYQFFMPYYAWKQ